MKTYEVYLPSKDVVRLKADIMLAETPTCYNAYVYGPPGTDAIKIAQFGNALGWQLILTE